MSMTTISSDAVRQLATLSAIALSDQEVERLRADITSILGYVEQLSELDTKDIEPTYQVTGLSNVWREDSVEESTAVRKILDDAPETETNQFKVPKVL